MAPLAEASADAGLDIIAGDLADAAILAGRASVDANIDSYLRALHADTESITAPEALDLYVGSDQSGTPSDVALVQSALTRSTGPSFTVSAGCSSSAAQLNNAFLMIGCGVSDIAAPGPGGPRAPAAPMSHRCGRGRVRDAPKLSPGQHPWSFADKGLTTAMATSLSRARRPGA
jgi:acetyl-CoA acetyltransferase